MLSRVIGPREAAGIKTRLFTPAPLAPAPSSTSRDSTPEASRLSAECDRLLAENQTLRANVATLEARLVSTKNDAFEAGHRQGEQHAQTELAPIVEQMNRSIADTLSARSEARHSAEGDVVRLAQLIAKRVLHRELATDPSALTALARVVFERMARSEAYSLTIHPQFLAAAQSALSGSQAAKVKIDPDPTCPLGTFVIRSAEGTIDASIDTQLEEISRGLADRLANG